MLHIVVQNQGESVARVQEGELLVLLRYLGAQGWLKTVELASLKPIGPGQATSLPPFLVPRHAAGKHGEGDVVAVEVEVDPVGIANEATHHNNRVHVPLPQTPNSN